MEFIIGLLAGGAGGLAAGALIRSVDMGLRINALFGLVGGALGAGFVTILGAPSVVSPVAGAGALDLGTVIAQVAVGAVAGVALLVVAGGVRGALGR